MRLLTQSPVELGHQHAQFRSEGVRASIRSARWLIHEAILADTKQNYKVFLRSFLSPG